MSCNVSLMCIPLNGGDLTATPKNGSDEALQRLILCLRCE